MPRFEKIEKVIAVQWKGDNFKDFLELGRTDCNLLNKENKLWLEKRNGSIFIPINSWLVVNEYQHLYAVLPETFEKYYKGITDESRI